MWVCFPPGWNGGFHLSRLSGESLGRLLRPVGSPRFKSLGCRATWSPWLLLYRAIASVTFRLRAATADAPVHHSLRQPCFPRKLWLRGCRRCLQLRILSRRSPLGRSLCSVSIFGLTPSHLLVGWSSSSGACLPFFLFPFPLES